MNVGDPGLLQLINAQMTEPEKLLLYALVVGLQPRSVLEIGVFEGGSSAIILRALDAAGTWGHLYSVDPNPQVHVSSTDGAWHLIRGTSPEALPQLRTNLNAAPFDFVFIDGDHAYESVRADIEGVIPYLADEAYLLFHDACNPDVKQAIDDALHFDANPLLGDVHVFTDCGMLCKTPVYLEHMRADYYGLRLVRFER